MTLPQPGAFARAFALDLPHGLCVGITLPADDQDPAMAHALSELGPGERALAKSMTPGRRVSFVGGRLALRAALRDLGQNDVPDIMPDDRGAPGLPPGVLGSISHKRALGIAIAAMNHDGVVAPDHAAHVGIDLEILPPSGTPVGIDVASRVLGDAERAALAHLGPEERRAQTLCAFSLKEALYKAVAPSLRRIVSFVEAELVLPLPLADNGNPSQPTDLIATFSRAPEPSKGSFKIEGRLIRLQQHIVSTVRVDLDAS